MPYILESHFENTLDIPVSLGATNLRMGDWLVVATLNLERPAMFTWNFCSLQILSSSVNFNDISASNYVNGNLGLVYLILRKDYTGGLPEATGALDIVTATGKGIFNRNLANKLVVTEPGSYSWIIVNNMKVSSAENPQIPVTTSIDFIVAVTGAARYTLWPKNSL
jgi:hypothetical protein